MPSMKSRLSWSMLAKLPHKVTSTEHRFNCIFCPEPDTEYHLYVNRFKGLYHCFRCGVKGKLRDLADTLVLDNFSDIIKKRNSLVEYTEEKIVKSLPRCRLLHNSNDQNVLNRNLISVARRYLYKRGLTSQEIMNNHLRVCIEQDGIYSNSIIFTIGIKDNPRYFVCRKLKGEPKYINAPWNKDAIMYKPKNRKSTPYIVVCEGVFDAIKIARVARVRALLGKEANRQQIEALVDLNKPLLICLDSDAQSYSMKLAANLATYYGTIVAPVFIKYKDPGEAPSSYLRKEFELAYLRLSNRSSTRNRTRSPRDGTSSNHEINAG